MNDRFSVKFVPSGRGKAQCASDPEFPDGKDIILSDHGKVCHLALPYPSPECGVIMVKCNYCGLSIGITAAGRPDDPKSITIRCAETVN